MTTKEQRKVRLVKCPKCNRILPEPEQVPLYTCGGCGTILQAKNYRRNKEAEVTNSHLDRVQNHSIGEGPEVEKSSGSSQNFSSSGEQSAADNGGKDEQAAENRRKDEQAAEHCNSEDIGAEMRNSGPEQVQNHGSGEVSEAEKSSNSSQKSSSSSEQLGTQNGGKDQQAVEHCNSEEIGAENSAGLSSSSEVAVVLEKNRDRSVIGSERDFSEEVDQKVYKVSSEDEVVVQKPVQYVTASSATESSSSSDHTVVGNKLELKFPIESEAIEKSNGKDELRDAIADKTLFLKQISEVDYTSRNVSERDLKVTGNEEPQNEDDQPGICNDVAFDKQNGIAPGNSANEASLSIESQSTETAMRFQSENLAGDSVSDQETKVVKVVEHSSSDIVRNQTNCLDADKSVAVAELVKEDCNETQQNTSECISEKLERANLSVEKTSAAASASYISSSHSSAADLKSVHDRNSSTVSLDNECEAELAETLKQNSEDFNDTPELGRSLEKPENVEVVDTQEELGHSLKAVTRSPAKGSPFYDGSVSSFDGNDDKVPGRRQRVYEEMSLRDDRVSGFSKESSEWNNVSSREKYYSNAGSKGQVKTASSVLSDEELRCGVLEEQESVRSRENGFPDSDNRSRQSRSGFPPRPPFYKRYSEVAAFETGSSSGYVHDEPPSHWAHNHPFRYEDQEPWQSRSYLHRGYMDRLRYEDQEPWQRRKGEYPPPVNYHDEMSGEMYPKPRYPGYNSDRIRRADSWSLSGNLPRSRYSGEVFSGNHQFHDPYMHRRPDDLRWSVQLPPPAAYYRHRPMPSVLPSREISWDPYDSYPTSPPRYMDSESYAWGQDTASLSDDQRNKDQILRRSYLREKRQVVKRHLRPMAGGAPFISCYFCYKVVQLPEHFLVISTRRRNHRLKCGACSNILQFSLESETCLAPSVAHTTEGAAENADSDIRSGEAQSRGRAILQHNSFGALGREKSQVVSKNPRNGETTDESYNDGAASAQSRQVKVTWQLPTRSKSPLHRLMGYSSPQDLLRERTANDTE